VGTPPDPKKPDYWSSGTLPSWLAAGQSSTGSNATVDALNPDTETPVWRLTSADSNYFSLVQWAVDEKYDKNTYAAYWVVKGTGRLVLHQEGASPTGSVNIDLPTADTWATVAAVVTLPTPPATGASVALYVDGVAQTVPALNVNVTPQLRLVCISTTEDSGSVVPGVMDVSGVVVFTGLQAADTVKAVSTALLDGPTLPTSSVKAQVGLATTFFPALSFHGPNFSTVLQTTHQDAVTASGLTAGAQAAGAALVWGATVMGGTGAIVTTFRKSGLYWVLFQAQTFDSQVILHLPVQVSAAAKTWDLMGVGVGMGCIAVGGVMAGLAAKGYGF
jgi:hypothetical protein